MFGVTTSGVGGGGHDGSQHCPPPILHKHEHDMRLAATGDEIDTKTQAWQNRTISLAILCSYYLLQQLTKKCDHKSFLCAHDMTNE